MSILRDLYNNKAYSDITFVVQGRPVQVHRCILSHCKYFDTMFKFYNNNAPITLNDITYEEFCQLLKFIYLGEIDMNLANLATWIHYANLYQIDSLKEASSIEFFRLINSVDLALEMYPLIKDIPFAQVLCAQVCVKHWEDATTCEDFVQLLQQDKDFLMCILKNVKTGKSSPSRVEEHDIPKIREFLKSHSHTPKITNRILEVTEDMNQLCENTQNLMHVCKELGLTPPKWYTAKYLAH